MAKIVSNAPPGIRVARPIVRFGQPWRLILALSDEMDADLIIVGSHGYHGLDRILGTTAARVANVSHRDVLVVHGRSHRADHVEGAAGPYRQSSH
jgi:nucleotide-binding universal stress UspA family protein